VFRYVCARRSWRDPAGENPVQGWGQSCARICKLAAVEKLDRGYQGRILMLTLLAPDIVQAIMEGRQPAELGVHVLREPFPGE
jgi:hypothetical protein